MSVHLDCTARKKCKPSIYSGKALTSVPAIAPIRPEGPAAQPLARRGPASPKGHAADLKLKELTPAQRAQKRSEEANKRVEEARRKHVAARQRKADRVLPVNAPLIPQPSLQPTAGCRGSASAAGLTQRRVTSNNKLPTKKGRPSKCRAGQSQRLAKGTSNRPTPTHNRTSLLAFNPVNDHQLSFDLLNHREFELDRGKVHEWNRAAPESPLVPFDARDADTFTPSSSSSSSSFPSCPSSSSPASLHQPIVSMSLPITPPLSPNTTPTPTSLPSPKQHFSNPMLEECGIQPSYATDIIQELFDLPQSDHFNISGMNQYASHKNL